MAPIMCHMSFCARNSLWKTQLEFHDCTEPVRKTHPSDHVSPKEEHRSRVFDKRALWRINGPKRESVRGEVGQNFIIMSFMFYAV
jgi:hypothetical protein